MCTALTAFPGAPQAFPGVLGQTSSQISPSSSAGWCACTAAQQQLCVIPAALNKMQVCRGTNSVSTSFISDRKPIWVPKKSLAKQPRGKPGPSACSALRRCFSLKLASAHRNPPRGSSQSTLNLCLGVFSPQAGIQQELIGFGELQPRRIKAS